MITCDYIGRCGNQMFQIATTVATALRNRTPYAFPTRSSGSYSGEVYFPHLRKVELSNFPVYREKSHAYNPIPPIRHAKLHGYWQSEKYFKEYRREVIDLFKIPYNPVGKKCSLHIRLGDYLNFIDKHPPVSIEYLKKAISYILETTDTRDFILFSDDIKGAAKMIDSIGIVGIDFEFTDTNDPLKDIALMSSCEHNITANSTFSWWGAWLNQNPDKKVIMPKQWFGPGNRHLETKDIYFENAIIL